MQRLRRVHQLGISYLTYPGADHNRLAHSLGVVHLTQMALKRISDLGDDPQLRRSREPLLAAALLHDVGHGPFSHVFEPCLGIDHEEWSVKAVQDDSTQVHQILASVEATLPEQVAALIGKNSPLIPGWQKYLISSQLDVDRMDYLRRDSLFTGASYGHFDWHRILNTFEFYGDGASTRDIVWPEKAKLSIEEYVFSRFYMYQNVYLHKTTRGFEKILEALWRHGKALYAADNNVALVPAVKNFWAATAPSVAQYLKIEEFTVMQQIQQWTDDKNVELNDLARRFLSRDRFVPVNPPVTPESVLPDYKSWEDALHELLRKSGYRIPILYCLKDTVKGKYNQPYFPEKQRDQQSAKNAIRIIIDGEPQPVEISTALDRLKPVTMEPMDRVRYYIPKDVQQDAKKLAAQWKGNP